MTSSNLPVIGDMVKFNGYDAECQPKIETATIIGYDEHTFYTKIISPKDQFSQHPSWSDTFDLINVTREFRLGFHRSRLIAIIKTDKIIINHNLVQQQLF